MKCFLFYFHASFIFSLFALRSIPPLSNLQRRYLNASMMLNCSISLLLAAICCSAFPLQADNSTTFLSKDTVCGNPEQEFDPLDVHILWEPTDDIQLHVSRHLFRIVLTRCAYFSLIEVHWVYLRIRCYCANAIWSDTWHIHIARWNSLRQRLHSQRSANRSTWSLPL